MAIMTRAPADVVRDALLVAAWFSARQRDLPWRRPFSPSGVLAEGNPAAQSLSGSQSQNGGGTEGWAGPGALPRRDPYRVWIAEIMLQQTQVATVIPYYERWMVRFPNVSALASASDRDVLEAWSGLGYYSRARNILVTARELAARSGAFPDTREGLLALKGVGEYTAGAIASLAFDRPEPILDGNLVRVFSRRYGMDFLPDSKANKDAYWDKAREWAAAHRPGLVNEGLMELGALVCTPRNPACGECPLAEECRARRGGTQATLPPPKTRKAAVDVEGFAVAVFRKGKGGREVLLYTPDREERLAGLLTYPFFAVADWNAFKSAWKSALPSLGEAALRPRPGLVTHGITHHRYRIRLAEGAVGEREAAASLPERYAWAPERELERLLVSSLPVKIRAALSAIIR
jgi:A/G-specific adenine glycosylase